METRTQERMDKLFNELVPMSGHCDTLEGEFIRAASKIGYRYLNDGDYWWTGYGCETAGPACAFLKAQSGPNGPLPHQVFQALCDSYGAMGDSYLAELEFAFDLICDYVEDQQARGMIEKGNELDMLDWESEYDDDEEPEY